MVIDSHKLTLCVILCELSVSCAAHVSRRANSVECQQDKGKEQKLIPVERRQIILEMVAEKGIVSIAELTDRMNVSHDHSSGFTKTGAAGSRCAGVRRRPVPGRVAHEPSHQVKTALAMTQKSGYWQAGGKSCSAGKLYLSGCGNDHVKR